ncbi:MAG: TadE/TadG family type IV pilus assembly protein [Anaerolineae bacterium]
MLVNRYKSKNSGQALVEFALILIVLLLLITFIIEVGRITWAWAAVQSSARTGARYAITGNFEPGVCDDQPIEAGCQARTESIHDVALQGLTGWRIREDVAYQEDNFTLVQVFGTNTELAAGQQLQEGYGGDPGQPVIVRVTYNVPIITPLLRPIVENVPVFGQVTLNNELFGQTGGRTEGQALPPPLPVLPELGPTDTPTPIPTATAVPTIDPEASLTPIPTLAPSERCPIKIQGQLIEGQRILEFTGDHFVNKDKNAGVYTIDVLDQTNGEIIASGIPVSIIPSTFAGESGCDNNNDGYVELDLADASAAYYINPAYAGGLPGGIRLVAQHENDTVDDQLVLTQAQATGTFAAPTLTPLPSETPTATPDVTLTPLPGGPFVSFPDGSNCVTPNPGVRLPILGGNWSANHEISFIWDNSIVLPQTVTTDANGFIATVIFDLGPQAAGTHQFTARDQLTGDTFTKDILIPCPIPPTSIPPTPTPTLSPPDLIISIPEIQTSAPITEFTPVEFNFTITNIGETDINSLFFVDLFLDPPAISFGSETVPVTRTYIIADPYSDGFIAVPDLAASESQTITIRSALGFQNDATGDRVAWGMVDSLNQIIDEEREDNNLSSAGGIAVTPAVIIPTATPETGEVAGPGSLLGNVRALYTEYVPQQRATVFLYMQPLGGAPGTVVAQTVTDVDGRYAFHNVPSLTGGDTYSIVACLSLAGSNVYKDIRKDVLPDPTKPVAKLNLFMEPEVDGCTFN